MPALSEQDYLRGIGAPVAQAQPAPQPEVSQPSVSGEGYYGGAEHLSVPTPPEAPMAPEGSRGTRVVSRLGGIEDMDRILKAIEMVESGGRDDITGPAVTESGKPIPEGDRAKGPMQIRPSTARQFGAKGDAWETGDAGRALGARIVGHYFAKYGNWIDALQAFYGGEAAVDDQIKKGRPPSQLTRQLTGYSDKVLERASLDNPARRFVEAKGQLNYADYLDIIKEGTPLAEQPPEAAATEADFTETEDSDTADSVKAFGLGAYRGALDMPVGLARVAGVEPAGLKGHIDRLDTEIGRLSEKHWWAATAGDIVGQTIPIMAGAGLVGRTVASLPELAQLATKVPALVKGAAGGAAVGIAPGAQEDKGSLAVRAALGAVGGTVGVAVGNSIANSAHRLIDDATRMDVITKIKDSVGALGRNATALRDTVVSHVQRVEQRLDQLYHLRDASGAGIRGFSTPEMGEAIDQAIQAKPELKALAEDTKKRLGVTEELARRAASEKDVEKYNEAMKKWQGRLAKSGVSKYSGPDHIRQAKERLAARGIVEPKVPPRYEPEPVRTADFAATMRHLSTRPEGREIRRALEREAGTQAAAVRSISPQGKFQSGAPLRDFMRNMTQADDFYKSEVAPFRELFARRFGSETPSPAQFYDWITHVVEHGDHQEIAAMRKILSTAGAQDHMQNVVMHKMLMAAGPNGEAKTLHAFGQNIKKYFDKHESALRTVLDRDHFETLNGLRKISERLLERPVPHKGGSWLGYKGFLWIVGIEHAMRGEFLRGAMIVGSGVAAHALFHAMQRIATDRPMSLAARQIAKMKPGKPMDDAINQLMLRYQARYMATGRVMGQGGPPQ